MIVSVQHNLFLTVVLNVPVFSQFNNKLWAPFSVRNVLRMLVFHAGIYTL